MKTCLVSLKHVAVVIGVASLAFLTGVGSAEAQMRPQGPSEFPNFDRRSPGASEQGLANVKQQAKAQLKQQLPSAQVDLDPLLESPKHIRSLDGFLTGPNGRGGSVGEQAARAVPSNDPHQPLKAFINEHAALFGHDARILDQARVKREGVDKHNGLRTVVWEQEFEGVPVYQGVMVGHITSKGELVSVSSMMVPVPAAAADRGTPNRGALQANPSVSALQAIQLGLLNIGQTTGTEAIISVGGPAGEGNYLVFKTPEQGLARLVWLPLSRDSLRLSWETFVTSHTTKRFYRIVLDAETGEVYVRTSLSSNISDATYNVFTSDSPSPFTPSLQTPGNFQPPLTTRQRIVTSALDVTASPEGWIPDGVNTTTGNNVDAFPDRNFDQVPDEIGRPVGNPDRVFDLPQDLTTDPTNYIHASTVQLFYMANWYHDRLYQLGFTEQSGNFQQNNFGRGGFGNDPVLAFVQSGADVGIANNSMFGTPPDGFSGECYMFIFDFPNPARDGSLDSEVVLHELTHGTSTRLVGGGMVIDSLQGGGMGEGWSDFYATALLSEPGDNPDLCYASGGYASYLFYGLLENYYFGIRHFPYSTDMTKNPFTFKDIDPAQISPHTGVPRNPIFPFSPFEANEVHHSGEVWCTTLLEVRANLIHKHGWTVGNELALQLVTDGMKLTPPLPNFLQARDAILLADRLNNGGANLGEIWKGFAKRGMGVTATSPNGNTTAGVHEAFDVPGLFVDRVEVLGGNDNRVVDPNECDELRVWLANVSGYTATGVSATLATTNAGVMVVQPNSSYPVFPNNSTNANATSFRVSVAPYFVCGAPIHFSLVIKSDQETSTNWFTLATGTPTLPTRYDNLLPAAIPDGNLEGTNSPVVVSNFVGAVTRVAVSLHLTHTFDNDLTLELISPDGTTNTLAANRGFNGRNYGVGCSPETLRTTFDDAATNAIGNANPPFIGVFSPDQPLAIFNGKFGTNVNGTWKLRVVDDARFDVGTLQCWSLFLYSASCVDGGGECPGSDMSVGMTVVPEPVIIGENLAYTITVINNGPSSAKNVVLTHLLPTSAVFVSGSASQGTISQAGGVVTANLGLVNARQTATITIVAFPTIAGLASSTATISSEQTDFNPLNNSVTIHSKVNPPTTDLATGLVASPTSLILGQGFSYTVSVTNRGPSSASGVMVTNVLPAGVVYVSSTTSQGTVSAAGNQVVCTFGSLTNGGRATAVIQAIAAVEGQFTATAFSRGNQFDPIGTNNTATAVVAIGPAADLAISVVDNPDPVVVNSSFSYLVTVTNFGPSIATGITVNQTLPAGVTVVETSSTQGSLSVSANSVICSLGNLAQGASASFTVRVSSPNTSTLQSTATVSATQADPNSANNAATASTVVMPPVVTVVGAGATLTAESVVPSNGAIDMGEQVTVILRLRNAGNVTTTNLFATLLATNGVTPVGPNEPQRYGVLQPSGFPTGKSFTFVANGTNGGTVSAVLALQDGATAYPPVTFQFTLPKTQEFANTNRIDILPVGAADPYPSANLVAGVTGAVSKVTATLSRFSHTYPRDVSVLLVGPQGNRVLLLSHASNQGFLMNGELTFDDAAASGLPDFGAIVSGAWKPSAFTPAPVFPPSAPAEPYESALATFNSIDPNGVWKLFVMDDVNGDSGGITNGWSLKITSLTPINQVADLAVRAVAAPANLMAGSNVVYTFSVTNAGPNPASFVAFSNAIPAGATLVSAHSSQGNLTVDGNTVIGSLDTLSTGVTATVTITLNLGAGAAGQMVNSATVMASETDLNQVNNTVTLGSTVTLPQADVALTQVATPNPVLVGNNATFAIQVTNAGPGIALEVTVTNAVPAGATLVSASSSMGNTAVVAGAAVARLGSLLPGTSATVTVVLSKASIGSLVNHCVVATRSTDLVALNNTVSTTVNVQNPAPMIAAAGASLTSESLQPVNGTIDPGETVTLSLGLKNVGSANTANLVATLQPSGGITPVGAAQKSYGQLVFGGGSAANSFTFQANGGNGEAVTATLQLQDGAVNLGTVSFVFNLPAGNSFSNTMAITVADHGAAFPYPSTIEVDGLAGNVSKVAVLLFNVSHSFPRDLNLMLVAPDGAKALLMAHAGGAHALTNVSFGLDDGAAAVLPGTNAIVAGRYKPAAYGSVPTFSQPAPAGPYPTALTAVNGSTPNGTWSLYVMDDSIGDSGVIAGGWGLEIVTVEPVSPVTDLAVAMGAAPAGLYLGATFTNVVAVTNYGATIAGGVFLTNSFPESIQLVSVSGSQGEVLTTNAGSVVWSVGGLTSGSVASVQLVMKPTLAGSFTVSAVASSGAVDLNQANNVGESVLSVLEAAPAVIEGSMVGGEFRLTMRAEPNLTYLIQASPDLVTWTTLDIVVASPGGTIKYADTNTPSFSSRYYRAVRVLP